MWFHTHERRRKIDRRKKGRGKSVHGGIKTEECNNFPVLKERKVNSFLTFVSEKERKEKSYNFLFVFHVVEDRTRFSKHFYQKN
jgi:hypothetical protein